MSNFTINGASIKNPSSFKIERYKVTSMERLANAQMVGDFIANKRKFYFTYKSISGNDLNTILNAIWETTTLFFTVTYKENNTSKSAQVYVGSIPSELYRAGATSNWVWQNVTFNLIEQ